MADRIFGKAPSDQEPRPRDAAYVVISEAGSVAVVQHGSTYFLPGGGAEPGESPNETVTRELAEELACEIVIDREIGSAVQHFYSADDQVYYRMTATFFTGHFATEPSGDVVWLPEAALRDSLFHECHRWAVEEAGMLRNQIGASESKP
jgi:8-oxo-dGTP pyrophosphatase MutT (NUDIX family)